MSILLIYLGKNRLQHLLAMGVFGFGQLFLTLFSIWHPYTVLGEYFGIDSISQMFLSLLVIMLFFTIYHSFIYLRNENNIWRSRKYYTGLILLVYCISGIYLSQHHIISWLFVELSTLAVSMLVYHQRTQKAIEATWKYLFLCSTGVAIAFMGIIFYFYAQNIVKQGNSELNFVETIQLCNPLYLKITFLFVLVGYSAKMGLFPMHTASIDAQTVTPSPINAIFSSSLKIGGFVAFYRIYSELVHNQTILDWMQNVLLISGFISVLVSAGYMLKADHSKRVLAYSGLEHIGLVFIGLGVGGNGYYAAFLHIILHSLIKAGLFFQMGILYRIIGTHFINDSGKYYYKFPLGGITILIGIVCLIGIPPSGLFLSEFITIQSLISDGRWIFTIAMLFLITIVIYALVTRVMHVLYSEPKVYKLKPAEKVHPVENLSQLILFAISVYLAYFTPEILKNWIISATTF